MSYKATVFKVFIASPSDVLKERDIIREVIAEWNAVNSDIKKIVLLPVGWETHSSPEMGDEPQSIINKKLLEDCDLLIGVFWIRVGTPTGEYISGTVEEIEEHIKAGKPVMLYFSDASIPPNKVDPKQYAALKMFKETCQPRGLCEKYDNIDDFKDKFNRQLQIKINQDDYFRLEENQFESLILKNAFKTPTLELTQEAKILLKEASQDLQGIAFRMYNGLGLVINTNGKQLVPDSNPRTQAIWEGALKELDRLELIDSLGDSKDVYKVTSDGYKIADTIKL